MNIAQVKTAIAASAGITLPNLVMVRQLTEDKQPTEWVSHWDNDHRVRVSMHQNVMEQIKLNPEKPGLAFKKEIVAANGERAAYTRFVVITPTNIEATF